MAINFTEWNKNFKPDPRWIIVITNTLRDEQTKRETKVVWFVQNRDTMTSDINCAGFFRSKEIADEIAGEVQLAKDWKFQNYYFDSKVEVLECDCEGGYYGTKEFRSSNPLPRGEYW